VAIELPQRIRWTPEGTGLIILDQTELPTRYVERELHEVEEIEEAIGHLRVRGAPLIGITAAMGIAALARRAVVEATAAGQPITDVRLRERVLAWCDRLAVARPTAVNLTWALGHMRAIAGMPAADPAEHGGRASEPRATSNLADRLRTEADRILELDRVTCRQIGEHAVALLRDGSAVVTHCNAGALATGGIGTALAPVYVAAERGLRIRVFANETRPLLQGSRLTAWELTRAGVPVTVISDNTAGALMSRERPDLVFVGADRIAANGDTANKIGTYALAVLARHHGIPFYVLAPTSTVDLSAPSGESIPIEHRSPDEVRRGFGLQTARADADVWSPAFDITPAELIAGIVTERGVHQPPYGESLRVAVKEARTQQ
jgi:methylthioribose-1-phosphate isomerase